MLSPDPNSSSPGIQLLGDLHLLTERLGSPGVSGDTVAATTGFLSVTNAAELRDFLLQYRRELLEPIELPAIQRAFFHASRHETRELIAFDQQLGEPPMPRELASASRRVGRAQLKRLHPLRDQRLVRRYLAAVESGKAYGWHTLVYGIGLHLYSLPLREGLVAYAHQTISQFIASAAPSLQMDEASAEELLLGATATLPHSVEEALAGIPGGAFARVPQLCG